MSTGLALKSAHVLIGLRGEKETVGQGNNGEGEGGDFYRLATSVDWSSGRKFDRAHLSQARTHELDLGSMMVSGRAGRLSGSACPFKDRRRGDGIKQEKDKEDGEKVRHAYCE